ncbi:hypothetical protein Tco_0694497 [Tanacetum coccineum]
MSLHGQRRNCAWIKVSSAGLEVDKTKIDVISKLPPPTDIKGIRSFLEHAGFCRCFIKDFSKIARPLTKLLEKDTTFEFDDECKKAFELLKEKLACAPVIVWKSVEYDVSKGLDTTYWGFLRARIRCIFLMDTAYWSSEQ